MKIDYTLLLCLAAVAHTLPHTSNDAGHEVASLESRSDISLVDTHDLFKRKGGGGGGGRGGGSSSGGSSSGSSGSGSSGSSGSSRPAGSSTSNTGGRTSGGGTGVAPNYGGGRNYAGGATVPYRAGGVSTGGLRAGALLPIVALSVFPGLWLYSAYAYPYSRPWSYYNASTARNETKPVNCLCQEYSVCGCDENYNSTYIDSLLGNGSYADQDDNINVADYNGTNTIFINGTLDNGTAAASETGSAGVKSHVIMEYTGYWLVAALVAATVMTV